MLTRTKTEWRKILKGIIGGYTPAKGKESTYESGHALMTQLKELAVWKKGDFVLDIGCGNGRLAIPLVGQEVHYLGIEPIAESAYFCEQAFAPWATQFKFVHRPIKNDFYNPDGTTDPLDFYVPAGDQVFDAVLIASVMTHLGDLRICRHYLKEVRRVLAPRGRVYVTWFRGPPNDLSDSAERSVFTESDIINSLKGFSVEATWGGLTQEYGDQWHMVLRKEKL